MKVLAPIVGFLVLWLSGSAWNLATFDVKQEQIRETRPLVVSLPKPEVVKIGALGFAAVLADLYWIGGSHYFGEPRYKPVNYSQFHEYIDIVNELAPDFHEPYYFGGAAIPWNTGTQWVNVEPAVAVLRRGVAHFPDDWRLHFLLAYDLAIYLDDFKDAGPEMERAAKAPGSPPYVLPLSARYLAFGGDISGAEALTNAMLDTAPDENTRAVMLKHKEQLVVERDLQTLEAALTSYKESHGGANPLSPEDPDFQRFLPKPFDQMQDPHHDRYSYDAHAGVFSSPTLDRFRPYGAKKVP